jgi:phosphatidate cytidylyltransferase
VNNLSLRIITAVVLVALIVCCLFVLPDGVAELLFALFFCVGAWEWASFVFGARFFPRALYVAVLAVIAAYLYISLASQGSVSPVLWVAIVWWLVAALWLARFDGSANRIWIVCAGFLALLPAFLAVLGLLRLQQGDWLFIWFVAIVAAADIGAYFTGKQFGRNKLAPSISPGKTREGVYGGLLAAVVVGAAGAVVLDYSPVWFALAGGVIAVFSVVGDLTVSAFKRQAGLKDSGVLLPGHGGVLDRIDGLIAAMPVFLIALSWA